MRVGILAFHGDVAEHREILNTLKVQGTEVRSIDDLQHCTHLIIPGGESTVMSRFLDETGVDKELVRRMKEGTLAVYGTCAGAILLATKVTGKNAPKTLGLLEMTIERNAYGTQAQSFEAILKVKGLKQPVRAAFIRAPVMTKVGKGIDVLATHGGHPVLVQQGNILAGTFHPEVRALNLVHELFVNIKVPAGE